MTSYTDDIDCFSPELIKNLISQHHFFTPHYSYWGPFCLTGFILHNNLPWHSHTFISLLEYRKDEIAVPDLFYNILMAAIELINLKQKQIDYSKRFLKRRKKNVVKEHFIILSERTLVRRQGFELKYYLKKLKKYRKEIVKYINKLEELVPHGVSQPIGSFKDRILSDLNDTIRSRRKYIKRWMTNMDNELSESNEVYNSVLMKVNLKIQRRMVWLTIITIFLAIITLMLTVVTTILAVKTTKEPLFNILSRKYY